MLQHIGNLKIISVIKGITKPNTVHTKYPHRLILRLTGTIRYHIAGETLELNPGDILFLPNSPTYFGELMTPDIGTYILVNFEGSLPDTDPRPYALYKQDDLHYLFAQMYQFWSVQTPASYCRCMALLYELLGHFAEFGNRDVFCVSAALKPALTYLEHHIFDPSLKISKLHTLCGISDTYFRKLFLTQFGNTPKRYVIDRRLSQAKSILENGEYDSIEEVALSVGFEDALYFSKVFRTKYAHPPSRL